MNSKLPILILLTALVLSSCGSYHNKIRFSKAKKNSTKEIVSAKEEKVTYVDTPSYPAKEVVAYEEVESPKEANAVNEIENTSSLRIDAVSEPVSYKTMEAPIEAEAAEELIAEEDDPERKLNRIQYSRNRAWLNTLGALLTIGTGIGLTILFFTSPIAAFTLFGGIIGAYIFYGFLCKHLYQAAVDSRIHKYTREEGDTSGNELKGWNLAHIIIASLFGFGIPLIVLGARLYEVKKKYKPKY
jgi:hypothetical protein